MTNKHYNWMTPDEAARELEADELIWNTISYYGKVEPMRFIKATDYYLYFLELGTEDRCLIYRAITEKCICRAIVPEVPSE